MTGQTWLADLLAGVMLLTAAYCLSRLAIARFGKRPAEHDVDAVHTVMGVSMAGMLTAGLRFLPNGVWAVLFGIAGVWFAWKVWRDQVAARSDATPQAARAHRGHDVPILLMCGAMVYMLLAGTSMGSGGSGGSGGGMAMGGSGGGSHFTILGFALALALFGYAIWATDHFLALARVSALRVGMLAPAVALAGVGGGTTSATLDADITQSGAAQSGATQSGGSASAVASAAPLSPRLAAGCSIVMAVVMAYMLVLML